MLGPFASAQDKADAHAREVTRLADTWVAEIKARFPITYLASGLPTDRHDGLEQNAPRDIASWREFLKGIEQALAAIPERDLVGRPEWVTWHYMRQGLAQSQQKSLHPLTRLLWFSGPGEGWATYAESFALELGLYSSDFEAIGALMASTTPTMVADLGMQIMGWTNERTVEYLLRSQPLRDAERAQRLVGTISGLPWIEAH